MGNAKGNYMLKKLLLIDAGGVLYTNVTEETHFFQELSQQLDVPKEALLKIYQSHEDDFEPDNMGIVEVFQKAIILLGQDMEKIKDFSWINELYLKHAQPFSEVFLLVNKLKKYNLIKLALANNEARHWDEIKDSRYHHFELFDFIASSWSMKACKPEVEYFNRIMLSNNVKSSEMLLIDDNPEVIKAASQLGIDTIFYKDLISLKRELELYEIKTESI
ncbi:hypothetical protein COD67_07655 [Bacillus cereus]|nr:hypothetical protein COI89_08720 [Bacillus cereus]PGU68132.1 hypothetical protein COD67_07655 [Bacillus cereus]